MCRFSSFFTIKAKPRIKGLLLREKDIHNPLTGTHWTSSLLFSLVQELLPAYTFAEDALDVDEAAKTIKIFNAFVLRIEELALTDAPELKPLLKVSTSDDFSAARRPNF